MPPLTELALACPVCLDSTMIEIVDPGLTSSGEDQDSWPILRCARGCEFLVVTVKPLPRGKR